MSHDRRNRDTTSLEEATVSNLWEIPAIVEVLEWKDLCTKQDLCDFITEFRRKNPLFELGCEVCRNGTVPWVGTIV